ncbi:cysteine desulfurase NifS [Sedimentisphaera salicampi]|uniref:cysteine desulfurase NifS n=1 Tax=Sedimentisphaera salicampi TaxID=1941349 RepID=UPI000B9BF697|nr:cysteine desulfurase NifS [Sedimentisphaera salicampi]OXU14987.1 Cysteine desulfurase [Sedimentisphaera salicampi]
MDTIYLDNNATTRVAEEVFEEMKPYFTEYYGNPSSMHTFGGQVGGKLTEARERCASLIGCDPSEITFTSGGTESDNWAIRGILAATPNRRKLITSRVEHPAVLTMCRSMAPHGYNVVEIDVDEKGRLDLDQLEKEVDEDTALVTIMWANNETGTIFPVEKIAEIAHNSGAVFHTDAVQAVGKIPVNMAESNIDLLSVSGHKLHGPKGVGLLYVRKGVMLRPFIKGGHQESGRRAGTENTAGLIGLGKACQLAEENIDRENREVKRLRDKLESGLLEKCSDAFVNGDSSKRLPNTTSISFEYIEGEAILLMLDKYQICASSGSACTSGSLEPSHVLRAMGVPFTAAHGSIRFSLSIYNKEEEIDKVIEVMPPVIKRLRELSPFGRQQK